MKTRNYEINRRQARRNKTRRLKERIKATTDNRLKAKLAEKLKRINPYLESVK